jgi:hypothetical protein
MVTSSARSRVGNPISFALQDETGLYTKANKMVDVAEAQRRGAPAWAAGRSRRRTRGTRRSSRRRSARSSRRRPTCSGSTGSRRRGCRTGTSGSGGRSTATSTSGPLGRPRLDRGGGRGAAADRPGAGGAVLREPDRAGSGAWLPDGAVAGPGRREPGPAEVGEPICLGFDGSDVDDWTAIRAETFDLHQFTPTDAYGRLDDLEPGGDRRPGAAAGRPRRVRLTSSRPSTSCARTSTRRAGSRRCPTCRGSTATEA